ncbi:Protein PRRC1 [Cryptotermes secundus]|uniref:Protein PRRC1 n=1 Tax=Cryptotermes secundus TaxID=105785 RepID=A0A2J7QJR7_9NEOP|nr:Protein PRRC1 [Cryptotermes secundus]
MKMMHEDSNGESTFEFVEKRVEEMSVTSNETLPRPASEGNLLSSVAPPSALPSFVSPSMGSVTHVATSTTHQPITVTQPVPASTHAYHPTTFSPVIPPSKGGDVSMVLPPEIGPAAAHAEGSGGLLGWVKGAVGSGGLLSKVAEKAKNSVDSMITTLDPQMREFLYSGGDVDVVVASDKEVKLSPVREAFQAVFGKATVSGLAAQATMIAAQPVGFAAGVKAAEERILALQSTGKLHPKQPIVAIENFLVEVEENKWYDVGVLMLKDPDREINLHTFTQLTPVPAAVVALAQEDTPNDYPLRWSGLAVTIGSLMASNLQVHHSEWHQALTGVSRREMLLIAAKVLAGLYKNSIGGNII